MGFDMVYGDVPVEVFNHESGFCPWEGVSFPAETIHKSAKVTGTVEVVYGYGGVGSERNCAKFEHELAFGRHRGGEWDAYTVSFLCCSGRREQARLFDALFCFEERVEVLTVVYRLRSGRRCLMVRLCRRADRIGRGRRE